MRIDEVTNPLKKYLVMVRAKGIALRTTVDADGISQARTICAQIYGTNNLISVNELVSVTNEAGPTNPPDPAQQRAIAMTSQAQNLKKQANRLKAQQAVRKAQERLRKAMTV